MRHRTWSAVRHGSCDALAAAALAAAVLVGSGSCGRADSPADSSVGKMSCTEMTQAYAQALEEARVCDPGAATEQCTLPVAESLSCACPIYVKNCAAADRLFELAQAFAQQKCEPEPCPEQCSQPTSGVCAIKLGNLTEGRCERP